VYPDLFHAPDKPRALTGKARWLAGQACNYTHMNILITIFSNRNIANELYKQVFPTLRNPCSVPFTWIEKKLNLTAI
jgi:hypothetical protein